MGNLQEENSILEIMNKKKNLMFLDKHFKH